ncbi:microcystin degradation protein MlrC [Variovorax paradoxus]|jgi:microcystin degradation protein MlrC|uniref:M81 family metallopeptidase n=1 Tax=Variovorax paradoxus TaxID=34073 RepID=UPI0006E72882|nr:microcystin degradation protein MlrC [Variovorax paradoxus]KPV08510.1 microcystin degradation protein MlrC [Variovorax paradoxus]KPV13658.1 microcystin degradation protein MlrC [Variovorax paradoxus]KPV23412.1 microcystin degradation protein MlrC [Variovorax paradoxus]KPV36500.1 microcystin degradation protein MlrC [Variovorax paradoxus]
MKVLIARLNHETNTFSPVPTPLAAFGPDGPTFGEQAYRDNKGMRTAMSAFIDLAEAAGAELVTPVSASANPSGPVDARAYDELTQRIVDAAPGCDAILLDLHGAMVAHNSADGEGDLLVRLRAAAPGVPIGVALDLHANVTPAMVENADVIVGFKTYPHVDMYETGEHAGRLLLDLLAGRGRPAMRWHSLPLMAHTLRSASYTGAMQRAIDAARAAEASGESLAVSILAGFSLSDIEAPCMSVIVVDAQSGERAQATADRIAAQMWNEREAFVYDSEPLADSVARAKQLAEGAERPVLLLDHGDNCMSGGSCDTMDVLQEALAQGLEGIGVGPLCDPDAVAELVAAGEGATATVALGNKVSLAGIGRENAPVRLTGIVRTICDGEYVITGPTYTGQRASMGRTVLFDIGAARIVVTERTQEPWDIGVFACTGLDPRRERFLLLKSRMYCRPVFEPLAAALVECDSRGVTSSDYGLFPFGKVRRPVFPLDPI